MTGMKRPLTPLEEAALRAKQSKPTAPGGALGQKRTGDLKALADARQAAIDRARAGAVKVHGPSDPRVGAVAPGAGNPAGQQGDGPPADPLDELSQMRADQAATRKATEEQLAASRAQALQDVAARSGLGRLGLSGSSAALMADTGRVQDRNAVLARAELDSAQRDDEWQAIQRQVQLRGMEEVDGVDYNGDGRIAGTTQQEQQDSNMDVLYKSEKQLGLDSNRDGVIGNPASAMASAREIPAGRYTDAYTKIGQDGSFIYYAVGNGQTVKVRR